MKTVTSKLSKTLRIILFVVVATFMTGCGLMESDLIESQQVKRDVLKLCGATDKGYSTSDVKVLNWDFNSDLIGDAYTGYIVTYEIGTGYYALVSLVEFDGTSRYDIDLIYRGRSLSDLNEYVYSPLFD
jgi:hypothetical protein